MADIFNEDGKYNKTDWESGDRITASKLNRIETAIEQISDKDNERHIEADGRLDNLEADLAETKDKVDGIDAAYKTADTTLTNRVNSVETSYRAADTVLTNRVNSVETAYRTSETNLTNRFDNLMTAYQNAVSNLTAKFNSLETAYKAADTNMTNNINNLDAAYKAADDEIQNNIDALDAAYKAADDEIQNNIDALDERMDDFISLSEIEKGPIMPNGWYSHNTTGINGQAGYAKVCTIKTLSTYRNIPVVIDYTQRGIYGLRRLMFRFTSVNNNDPDVDVFRIQNTASRNEAVLHKTDAGTWDLYIKKTEPYDDVILWYNKNPYDGVRLEIEWKTGEQVSDATTLSGALLPELWNCVTKPYSGNWWNNSTPIVSDAGIMDIGKYIDFHATSGDTNDYNARLYCSSSNHISMMAHFHPSANNTWSIGGDNNRWQLIYLQSSPNVSSDRSMKENISYINSKSRNAEQVTYSDMYNFVKDDLELAEYNFKNDTEHKMNFIAQDLLYNLDGTDNKVGQMIVNPVAPPTEEEIEEAKAKLEEGEEYTYPTLSYDTGMYISVLAGALKESLHQIEQLKARIDELENK